MVDPSPSVVVIAARSDARFALSAPPIRSFGKIDSNAAPIRECSEQLEATADRSEKLANSTDTYVGSALDLGDRRLWYSESGGDVFL